MPPFTPSSSSSIPASMSSTANCVEQTKNATKRYTARRPKIRGYTRRHKANLESFLVNLLHDFLDQAGMDVVQLIGSLNRYLRAEVKTYLLRRYNNTIRPWIDDAASFRDHLRRSSSIIGGSVALDMALCETWTPKNMDIYTPRGNEYVIVTYLILYEGYDVDTYVSAPGPAAQHHESAILSISTLYKTNYNKDSMQINVIESTDPYAFSPLFQSSSTLGISWMTADAITIGYPTLTMYGLGMYRKRHNLWGQANTSDWKTKCLSRGFKSISRSDWRGPRSCGPVCRSKMRSTEDTLCLTLYFGKMIHRDHYQRRIWAIRGFRGGIACCNAHCPFYRLTAWDVNSQSGQIYFDGSYS